MKKIFTLIIPAILSAAASFAQVAGGKVAISDLSVREDGATVEVKFTAAIDKKAVKRNHTLVFAPVITDGGYRQSLPPVVVHGPGSKIARGRREWIARETAGYDNAVYASNGETVKISATVPSQLWMDRASILMESVTGGCCDYTRDGDMLLADDVIVRPEPEPAVIPEPEPAAGWVPVTVADSLFTAFTFVRPFSEFDEEDPFKIHDDERENALVVYYRLARHDIDETYMDNSLSLTNLTGVIDIIMSAPDSEVKKIVVAGFASPEGSYELNDRLAFDRAVSVKQHIMETVGVKDGQVLVYNGSVDWRGLRAMVAKSNLPEKQQIISIIDNTPVWDSRRQVGRNGELMRLNGGRTYRYLLNEYFPYLRNGAFIKVYYENR